MLISLLCGNKTPPGKMSQDYQWEGRFFSILIKTTTYDQQVRWGKIGVLGKEGFVVLLGKIFWICT